ncbi:MAG: mercuric reductase [Candidatus Acidoferrum typicum]|nr:mercuric reductase [Candidatus Acidoferrum typicum]
MGAPEHYHAIVIGSGQGGTPLCRALAEAGLRTALIERSHIGGTCVNEGCTPTKTMVASGRVAYLARRGKDYGVQTGEIRIDMRRVRQRKRDIVDSFRNGSQARLEKTANLDLIFGEASFTGPKTLSVRMKEGVERTLSAQRIFINAGARPAVPELDGLREVPFLDSTSIMELDSVPEHLLVLGGGYVGLEFGQMFRRFGSRVTIVQSGAQVLTGEDADVASEVLAILKQDGMEVLLNSRAVRVTKSGGQIQLTVRAGKEESALHGSHLLAATGRRPNTDTLNVRAAGIAMDDRGFIKVNGKLETNVEGVYALGDIKDGPAFTHISYDDYRILRTNLIEKGSATTENRLVPYTVFVDPQLGRVGITESEARAQNKTFRVAKMPMSYVARALEVDETRGFMKAIVDSESNQILGAAVLGIEGGEIMAMLELAMMGKLPFTALREGIFAHPTLAESLNNLFTHFV